MRGSNFFAAKFQPLNNTEDIVVFSTGGCNNGAKHPMSYFPQGLVSVHKYNRGHKGGRVGAARGANYKPYIQKVGSYPYKIIKISMARNAVHPTQKPVALMEYLIKTYTNPGNTVLDFAMGSGTTGVACVKLDRRFIGIEIVEKYFDVAEERIREAVLEAEG